MPTANTAASAETEALVPILRRLMAIERRLGLVEEPQPPQAQPAAAIGAVKPSA